MGRKKQKTLSKHQEGQEKYLIQTVNIVISSHSLHSPSSSTGGLGEPRNAELPGMRVLVVGAPGGQHACRGLQWNIPTIGSGLLQPPVNCRLAEEPGEGTAEGNAASQSRAPTVRPGPSPRTPVLSRPRLPAAGPPPLTSARSLALSPPSPPRAL